MPGNDSGKRICVVTGVHGDELEGQYVVYLLNRRIQAHPELLTGTVDIYPAVNPLGINTIQRGIPLFDLDMNRIFPGDTEGPMVEYYAHAVVEDMRGADIDIDIHASNIYLRELPQVRIHALREEGDPPPARCTPKSPGISIHALCEEGDAATRPHGASCAHFYPRPPRGGRLGVGVVVIDDLGFLSTPSARRATCGGQACVRAEQKFLSTPSARRATTALSSGAYTSIYFYPRPPRGGRPADGGRLSDLPAISIHALREEGDRPQPAL